MVLKNIPVVSFLTVYPNREPLQKLDIEDAELRALVSAFSVESKSRQVVIHDIYDYLKEKA